jgi:hypothetical protein
MPLTAFTSVRDNGLRAEALLLMCLVPYRLRRALLDAEIDTQRSTVAADTATKRLSEMEAELTKAKYVECPKGPRHASWCTLGKGQQLSSLHSCLHSIRSYSRTAVNIIQSCASGAVLCPVGFVASPHAKGI